VIPNCFAGDVRAEPGNNRIVPSRQIIINISGDHLQMAVRDLRNAGFQIWGWQYIRGDNPIEEARFAVTRINEFSLDGIVIRTQEEFKRPGKYLAAREFIENLRLGLPNTPLALSSYKFPSYHPHMPWEEFLTICDYNMPQFCSHGEVDLEGQISRCQREFQEIRPYRPVIPICPVSRASTKVEEVLSIFRNLEMIESKLGVSEDGITGQNERFWGIIQNRTRQILTSESDIVHRFIEALNTNDVNQVIALYAPQSALVTSARIISGKGHIAAWYHALFTQVLPDVNFILANHSGAGNSRTIHWIARSNESIFESNRVNIKSNSPSLLSGSVEIFKSVYYKKIVRSTPRRHTSYVVSIDLNDPSIDLMVTPPKGLGKTTSDFMTDYGQQLAINGDEWLSWTNPKGLAVSEGVQYSAASPEPTVYISASNQMQVGGDRPPVIWDAISGSHTLVRDGQIYWKLRTCAKPEVYCVFRAPRTSIGLTGDNKLILIVVQGTKDSLRNALTLKELATLNLELGVFNAISFDGGGSSTLAVDDYGITRVVNSPSDGSERPVSNHLGIRAQYLDSGSYLKVDDGNDTLGLLDGKIIYHFTSLPLSTD